MRRLLISIIIPVYNAERYLDSCMQSILGNDVEDIEVIFVDDGSTDLSGRIVDGYAESYGFVKVLHKENGGSTSARNEGLAASIGEWIWFVDADDLVAPYALQRLKSYCSIAQSEAIQFKFSFFDDGDRLDWDSDSSGNEFSRIPAIEFLAGTYTGIYQHFNFSFLLRRRLLDRISDARTSLQKQKGPFDEKITLYEDVVFCEELCRATPSVIKLNAKLYGCRDVATSVTHCPSNVNATSGLRAVKAIDRFDVETDMELNKSVMEIGLLFSIFKLSEDDAEGIRIREETRNAIVKRVKLAGIKQLAPRLLARYLLLRAHLLYAVVRVRRLGLSFQQEGS